MFSPAKRSWLKAAAFAAVAALAACGKDEPPPPKAAAPAADAKAPAPAAEPFKVAWMYVGPVGDAGWTFAHDQARKAVEAEFGAKVKTSFVEKVPEGADAERVIRDLAAQGNKLIFATSFGFMEPMLKVAGEFPDVKFEHATGYKTAPTCGSTTPSSTRRVLPG
jgi:simple sugar transport system substrate-binding protein